MNQPARVQQHWLLLALWPVWPFLLTSLIGGMPAAGRSAACGEEGQRHYAQGVQIGQDYAAQGRPCDEPCLNEKLRAYQLAVSVCPDHAEIHNNLGDVYERLGRFAEALRHYQRSIELKNPNMAVTYLGLGDVYLRTGEYAQAVAAYDQGLRLDPKDPGLAEELRSQRANAELLRDQQKNGNPDAATIAAVLGDHTSMGVGGVRPDRRVALRISFASASDRLLPEAQQPLRELGKALGSILVAEPHGVAFVIEGHTDLRGSEEYNFNLSLRRARQVKEVLVREFQIPARQLTVIGRGKTVPLTTGTSEPDNARNRRVEIVRQDIPEPAAPSVETPALEVVTAIFHEGLEGRPRPLEADAILRSGDGYRISLKPRQSCYVYLLQQDSTGKVERLKFDGVSDAADQHLQADTEYWAPSPSHWFYLDRTQGKETLYFIASHEPITQSDLENLLRTASAALERTVPELEKVVGSMGIAGIRPIRTEATTVAPLPQDREVSVTTFTFQHQ